MGSDEDAKLQQSRLAEKLKAHDSTRARVLEQQLQDRVAHEVVHRVGERQVKWTAEHDRALQTALASQAHKLGQSHDQQLRSVGEIVAVERGPLEGA
jgi:CTP-dependent riboflavin kinase